MLLLLLCGVIPLAAQDLDVLHGCPPEGDASTVVKAQTYRLKARYDHPPESFIMDMSLEDILTRGDDTKRWEQGAAVRMIAYVDTIFMAGPEDCNCDMNGDTMRDTRIYLTMDPDGQDKKTMMIAEVTPRMKALMKLQGTDWSTQGLRAAYQHHWVEVTGWLFFDRAHVGNAINTKPTSGSLWRATAWEVHPVTAIVVVD